MAMHNNKVFSPCEGGERRWEKAKEKKSDVAKKARKEKEKEQEQDERKKERTSNVIL
jgi:hypothetical protein